MQGQCRPWRRAGWQRCRRVVRALSYCGSNLSCLCACVRVRVCACGCVFSLLSFRARQQMPLILPMSRRRWKRPRRLMSGTTRRGSQRTKLR